MELENPNLRLEPHATARNKAVAKIELLQGSVIIVSQPITTVLLAGENHGRCNFCHKLPTRNDRLFKCTGCASFWYCDTECQGSAWKAHHKRICRSYPRYISTSTYGSLSLQEKTDALLLSQLGAEILLSNHSSDSDKSSLFAVFKSLMPSKSPPPPLPPMPVRINATDVQDRLLEFYARFRNNNFILHSHLDSFGHGIYPLASRLFNHSCVPNAVVRYSVVQGRPPLMEVIALRMIAVGEEVREDDRQRALAAIYGFSCSCSFCAFQKIIVPSPSDGAISPRTKQCLLEFTRCFTSAPKLLHDSLQDFSRIPETLYTLLAESFSSKSHGTEVESALPDGLTLLALYCLIYPPNYPQIG
ncbi:hypothetical protein B0F90DRAFT_1704858 [Multifurca ochricompacta]|uniref:MYND-type domain-containing protein n=1 Tax=Multifurca ochricompacta TaxID=376703 RepID=A0AAD4QQ23_9AGAM|nr:hypothetical protein B0F90DRAFT_1704858 [Multifurca ochricompacta]